MFGTRKLGKTSEQRRALLRQQVTDLLEKGKIETTFYRAKEVQPVVEKMITLGKKGNLAAYRRAMGFVTKEDVVQKLFKEIAPKYAERNGGYTRDGCHRAGVISDFCQIKRACPQDTPFFALRILDKSGKFDIVI